MDGDPATPSEAHLPVDWGAMTEGHAITPSAHGHRSGHLRATVRTTILRQYPVGTAETEAEAFALIGHPDTNLYRLCDDVEWLGGELDSSSLWWDRR
ncbi:hypothetical protein JMM63_20900 [Rhodovulum sulfidophilum]|uniref:hypothetical protein n=1 Tax=Rhodovulum sulfidophilum TaxID=35806 RepID=UPI0019244C41|nr:hypothetical protein [Rhodovulum sulfidophilum]MBL3597976.1 hypothetical protein [Rhodovulum sulfidophilum]